VRRRAATPPRASPRCAPTTCSQRDRSSSGCRCIRPCCARRASARRGLPALGMTAIDIGPGERAQPVHPDDLVMTVPRPHPPAHVHRRSGRSPISPTPTAPRGSSRARTSSRVGPTDASSIPAEMPRAACS
jgi:hypothetical protein